MHDELNDKKPGIENIPDEDLTMPNDIPVFTLEDQIATLSVELENERDLRLRAIAEAQNFRRRTMEERAQQMQYANERLLSDLIPVIDHFEMATEAAESSDATRMVCKGYEMILQQLKDVAAQYGMQVIPVIPGTMFDPQYHEACERVHTDDACEGTIVGIQRNGYQLYDRVLRPAQVSVAVPTK